MPASQQRIFFQISIRLNYIYFDVVSTRYSSSLTEFDFHLMVDVLKHLLFENENCN